MEALDLGGTFIFLAQDFYFLKKIDIFITNKNHAKASIFLIERL